ncbi:carboxymuconolactone decarboxylase family protein [Lysinibacillus sp. BW-2-10]|uniref:carboxymuconolactone decarboxylase family protein n=1 Tax=Lysinibacillus sp. BW-2-10 TaxID=2590030 RepID=UPI00117C9215|nr:carboxymuconolactone decarboxylase family protein [Lysinibacillus sp. BW-2-10]TSI06717.1 alkylhydroperoxidase [Lysinibacillus sp. BW-2-10]
MSSIFESIEHAQAQLKELAPNQWNAFQQFNELVFKEGALSVKEKEIIAVAVTHITQCSRSTDFHTKAAKKAGASLKELVEAAFVATAIKAGGGVTHGTHVHNAKKTDASDFLYARSNLQNLKSIGKNAHEGFKGYTQFNAAATTEGMLSTKLKEIIAVAVGIATQCPYCIDVHTKKAENLGATNEELAEAIMISSVVAAGSSFTHIAKMIQSYND